MRIPAALFTTFLALAPAPVGAQGAPFEPSLLRLAEILGSLHFLQTLCKSPEGVDWRAEMEQVLAAEAPDEARRARFVASFNSGYRTYAASYPTCTASAKAAIALYRDEGAALTRDVTARFGN